MRCEERSVRSSREADDHRMSPDNRSKRAETRVTRGVGGETWP